MGRLSTELDDNIARRLAKDDLNALSRTNKYYRALAEPHLYRNLVFNTLHIHKIVFLFRTIIQRPALAEHIRSLVPSRDLKLDSEYEFTMTEDNEFWQSTVKIKEIIYELTHGRDIKLALRWLSRIYQGKSYFDGAPGVVLCLAFNVEHLDLEASASDMMPLTCEILCRPWRDLANDPSAFPFHKLQYLSVEADSDHELPYLPSLSTLCTKSRYQEYLNPSPLAFPYQHCGPNLRTLEIKDVPFNPYWFEAAIARPELAGITELIVYGQDSELRDKDWTPGDREAQGWHDYSYNRISEAIQQHLPRLEVFAWSSQSPGPRRAVYYSLGSFKGLSKLRSLKVDFDLIRQRKDCVHIEQAHEFLPNSLEVLHICDLTPGHYGTWVITDAAPQLNIPRLELSIRMEHWNVYSNNEIETKKLIGRERNSSQRRVSALAAAGIELRIWRQKGRFPAKLLFAPGFEELWPQWDDVDMKYWCDHDRLYHAEVMRMVESTMGSKDAAVTDKAEVRDEDEDELPNSEEEVLLDDDMEYGEDVGHYQEDEEVEDAEADCHSAMGGTDSTMRGT